MLKDRTLEVSLNALTDLIFFYLGETFPFVEENILKGIGIMEFKNLMYGLSGRYLGIKGLDYHA